MILLAVIVVAVIIVIIAAVCNSNGSNDKPVNGDAADIVTVDENGAITALAMGTVKLKAGKDKINIDVIEAP